MSLGWGARHGRHIANGDLAVGVPGQQVEPFTAYMVLVDASTSVVEGLLTAAEMSKTLERPSTASALSGEEVVGEGRSPVYYSPPGYELCATKYRPLISPQHDRAKDAES